MPHPLRRPMFPAILLALAALAFVPAPAFADDEAKFRAVLEMPWELTGDIPVKEVVAVCTGRLDSPTPLPARDRVEALLRRGRAQSLMARPDRALADFDAALAIDPQDQRVRYLRALTLAEQGKFDEGMAQLRAVGQEKPPFPLARISLAALTGHRGDIKKALEILDAVVPEVREPRDRAFGESYRAFCLWKLGRYEEARNAIDRSLGLDPTPRNAAFTFAVRGAIYGRLKDWPQAEASYREAVQIDPDNFGYRQGLVQSQTAQGRGALACLLAEELVRRHPKQPEAFCTQAEALWTQGRLNDAVQATKRGLALAPKHPRLNYVAAQACGQRGEFEEALKYANAALGGDPDYVPAMFLKIELLTCSVKADRRDVKEALRLAQRACELTKEGPDRYLHARAMRCRALSHAVLGEFEEAERWVKQALELGKDDEELIESCKVLRKAFRERRVPSDFQLPRLLDWKA